MNRQRTRRTMGVVEAADGDELDQVDPEETPDRATLLETEAAELRERLDALLDAIGRHGRRGGFDSRTLRRYAPALIAAAVTGAGLLAFLGWRRRRRLAAWARLGPRLTGLF